MSKWAGIVAVVVAASGGSAACGSNDKPGGGSRATDGGSSGSASSAAGFNGGEPTADGGTIVGGGGVSGGGESPSTAGVSDSGGASSTGAASGTTGTSDGGADSGGGTSDSGGMSESGGTSSSGGTSEGGGMSESGGSSGDGGQASAAGESGCVSCTFMGENTVRIGASMDDDTASAAPFDARYLYLAGALPGAGECESCSEACGEWWGCWQDWAQAPGQYVTSFLDRAEAAVWQGSARPQLPFVTYYTELQASGLEEGEAQVAALDDADFLARYLADWRLVLERIGSRRAMLHLEPDLWGYVRFVNSDPHQVPAQVTAANPVDCADQEDSVAGLARCMIQMVRDYAPAATVGLHASAWLIDVQGDGQDAGAFMEALGAGEGDFVVSDTADRDAGYYDSQGRDTWWNDDADAQKYLDWVRDVSESICRPAVVWQIPVGNMGLDNTTDHWQDTRLDWLFAHMPAVAEAHISALFFGAGAGGQTTPETDGGNLIAQTAAYRESGATKLCP